MTYAAVAPKISALLAFVRRPTTMANRHVNRTSMPICKDLPESDVDRRHTIAPMRRTALKRIERIALATWMRS